ncbi:UPF0147 family protein [Candidatus Woesearchaeota archaeon]|nr:UPF0147 family protein [Candidatus Woesearchaeota archaeon]
MSSPTLIPVLDAINEVLEDATLPRNVKSKLEGISKVLTQGGDLSLNVDKALQELDDISDDANLQPFTRTQVWNIVSLLEKVQA